MFFWRVQYPRIKKQHISATCNNGYLEIYLQFKNIDPA